MQLVSSVIAQRSRKRDFLASAPQDRLVDNIVGSLSGARRDVQMRQFCYFFGADMKYGMKIAAALGIEIDPSMMP